MSAQSITVEDKYARDATTVNFSAGGNAVTISVYDRYGGDDEEPVSAGVTISRADWERIKQTVDAAMEDAGGGG